MEIINLKNESFNIYNTHLEGLVNSSDNGIVIAASNLNRSKWTGEIFHFKDIIDVPTTLKPNASLKFNANITNIINSENDRFILSTVTGSVMLIDLNIMDETSSFSCLEECTNHDSIIHSISINDNFSKLISTGQDCSVSIYDLNIFKPISSYVAHNDEVIVGSFVPFETELFVTADQENTFILWDIRNSKPANKININFMSSIATSVAFEPSKTELLIIGTDEGHLLATDIRMPRLILSAQPHSLHVTQLLFTPKDFRYVATCGHDSKVAVTNISTPEGSIIFEDIKHKDYVRGLCWKGDRLLACSWDGVVTSRTIKF